MQMQYDIKKATYAHKEDVNHHIVFSTFSQ